MVRIFVPLLFAAACASAPASSPTVVDDTRIRLLPADADGVVGVAAEYGRMMIQAGGQPDIV